VADVLSSTRS